MNVEAVKKGIFEAGRAIKSSVPSEGIVTKEGIGNFVTAADLQSEKILVDTIKENFPGHAILSEETESSLTDILSIDNLWVIDPIDGTNNFRFGRNYSSISIGYVEKGIIKMGMVYDIFGNQLFFAEEDKGAFVNDQRIKTGNQTDFSKASVATDNAYLPEKTRQNLELLLKINPTPWYIMRGSAVLTMCEVAAGRVDLYFQSRLKPWDNAAAFLIVHEAGGVTTDFMGNDVNFTDSEVLVGNRQLVEQFVNCIK